MKIRTIHVGVGNRGLWPLDVVLSDARFEPVAIVDTQSDFLSVAERKLDLPRSACFSNIDEALATVDADAAVICTPTKSHGALMRAAFAACLDVIVEKGMTTTWEDAKSLVREASALGRKFCVAQNYRYFSNERTISRILGSPNSATYPGNPMIIDYIQHRCRTEPRSLNYPYAMVWDMSCHHADSLTCWLGKAHRVTARSYSAPWSQYEHDANIAALIEYETGAICNYILTHTATYSDWRVTLQGEKGTLRTYAAPGVQFFEHPGFLGSSEPVECPLDDQTRPEQAIFDSFYHYVQDDVEPGISGRNNLEALAVCEMLVRSATERREVLRSELG